PQQRCALPQRDRQRRRRQADPARGPVREPGRAVRADTPRGRAFGIIGRGVSDFELRPIGTVRSELTDRDDAPKQGDEGAPDAWLEFDREYATALADIKSGDDVFVLTWFHLARRDKQQVRPRSDPNKPMTGVFSTRSPDRPNPIGLHRVTVLAVDG